jgi:DHA1 family bicyclomycin/chloramphenicol resistance-like MFS transporter
MDPGHTPERKQPAALIIVLASIMAIGPFSTDMYLPAFLAIARGLGTDIAHVGLSLTSFFVGVSIGQIVYGPLLDRRTKKPLMLGFLVYTAPPWLRLSQTIHFSWPCVFSRAVGACVGIVGSRRSYATSFRGPRWPDAVLADDGLRHCPDRCSHHRKPRGVRVRLAVYLCGPRRHRLLVFWPWAGFSTRQRADASISLHPKTYAGVHDVFRNRVFLTYGLVTGAAPAGFFAYIAGSAVVYMGLLGFTETEFGFIYGGNVIGLVLSNQVNRILLRRHGIVKVLRTVTVVQFLLILFLLIGGLAGFAGKAAILCLVFCYLFGFGCITSNAIALALQPFTRNAGSAAALSGSLQMVAGALSSGLLTWLHNGTIIPVISIMAGPHASALSCSSAPRRSWTGPRGTPDRKTVDHTLNSVTDCSSLTES